MENRFFNINDTEVQMTMVVKLHQLQREGLPALTYRNLEEYLQDVLWRDRYPKQLQTAVDDVLSVTAGDIVQFLSRQAIVDGSRMDLEDFADLIGG